MALLTRENLDRNAFPYTDYNAYARGREYYQAGRVQLIDFDGESAACRVTGQQGNYVVLIRAASRERVNYTCNCPQAAKVRVCKHMVASMLVVRDFIKNTAENQWQYRLALALEKTPRSAKARERESARSIALLGLECLKLKAGKLLG